MSLTNYCSTTIHHCSTIVDLTYNLLQVLENKYREDNQPINFSENNTGIYGLYSLARLDCKMNTMTQTTLLQKELKSIAIRTNEGISK
jgi:hypothetical protein